MEVTPSARANTRPTGARVVALVALVGVTALVALIARELMPRHSAAHATVAGPEQALPVAAPLTTATVPGPAPRSRSLAPVAAAGAPAIAPAARAVAAVPLAASVISQVAANPDAFAPSHVFSPPAGPEQVYNFEPLPPFNSTTLKRSRTNPAAWELDAMHGPKLSDLGPEGAVRQAAIVKDSIGNETPWYAIDAGPLAPAYAVIQAGSVRVMSRAFMLANREELPAGVAATLDR